MTSASNVDSTEIAKFNDIASRWWDPQGEFKPLHQLNPTRLSYIADQVQGLFGKTTIDVGCGGGILAESMARAGAVVTGIDMADEALTVARLHALEAQVQISYQQSTAEAFAEAHPAAFDLVTCMEMLEHVPDPESVIRACAALAKPGATLVFSTLNKTWKAYALAIVAAERLLKLVPQGTHEFNKFIRPSDLMRAIENAGLELVDATGLHYNPINQSFKTGPGLDVNYFVVARKPC
ncbi:bifunctional 2-polyprenyl-6-hydroxyphenol methylase/3-demethylubiquinol 3-O-methyltransferase UbiG [Rheinheimera sp.]|uniref:bifunctional 2-polyprenyl-6-hydroxyphenol methylase/3-demethylubiquinol 3-O-methyltransferase UbiG n=1 Tax=Rheinheimera sp. TaxID=1869214 RepID=UPI00307CFDDB